MGEENERREIGDGEYRQVFQRIPFYKEEENGVVATEGSCSFLGGL